MSTPYELTPQEQAILQKHEQVRAELAQSEADGRKEYLSYSRDRKVRHWLASIGHGMRMQGSSVGGEYTEFSAEWYAEVLGVEADFDSIFKEVVPLLGFEFDWELYAQRIASEFP